MNVVDLAVVGAGPAGCAAAAHAARRGLDVVLIDKARFPRDKCCGDGLTAAALRELEGLGLHPQAVPSWQPVTGVVLHAPSHRRIELSLPSDERHGSYSVVARRAELDAALVNLAVSSGATLFEGENCRAVTPVEEAGAVELALSGRTIRARSVVAADGMWSPMRKLCDARHEPRYRGEWHAFRQYFTAASCDAARRQHVWFPGDLLPAYVWSFPLADGGVNVGFGIQRNGKLAVGDGTALWRSVLDRPEIRNVLGERLIPDGPMRAWPIPARIDHAGLAAFGGRVLFVGDAATAADPMTGEGIGQALQTGRLAATAITAHLAPGATLSAAAATEIGVEYVGSVRAELVTDHRLARGLSRILAFERGAEWALRAVDCNDWTRRNFARWMFEDYPRALLVTPRRWSRGQFHRRGAYAGR